MAEMQTMKAELDATTTDRVVWAVGPYITGTVQVHARDASWSSSVVTIKRSNDGWNFYDLESAVTLSDDGMTDVLDLSGFAFLSVEVTTTNAGAPTLEVIGAFKT